MRRKSDPSGSLVVAFVLGAVVLHWAALAGGSTLVRRYGGFGLADPWERSEGEHLVQLELVPAETHQVVEINRPKVERTPKRTRFRSEWSSDVKKETVSRHQGLPNRAVAMVDRRPQESSMSSEPRVEPDRPKLRLRPDPKPSPLVMRTPASPRGSERRRGKSDVWKRKLTLRDLRPDNGVLQKVIPGAFPDYLKDIEKGNETLLKTKEWKFASFFNRVKRAVAQHWHPDREYSRRDPKGNIYGFKTRTTILHVLLHPSGALKKIVLERPCGLTFLDDEAISAFKKAAPFPNPPMRLVNKKTRQIAFRFGFIFEITTSPRWRVIRLK